MQAKYFKLYRYLRPYWKKSVLLLSLSWVSIILSLLNPYLAKLVIDRAYAKKNLELFIILILIGTAGFLINGMISGLTNYLNNYIRLRVGFDLSRKVFKNLQGFPYDFFQNRSTGENLYKISHDADACVLLVTDTLPQLFLFLPKTLLIFVIVLFLNWKIALFALAFWPFLYLLSYFFSKKMKERLTPLIGMSQDIYKQLQEALAHVHLIKAFGMEDYHSRFYTRTMVKKIRQGISNARSETACSFAIDLANRAVLGLVTVYGGYQLVRAEMTLGNLSAVTLYLSQLSGLQCSFAQFFRKVSAGIVSYERLESILENGCAKPCEGKKMISPLFSESTIEFKDVTFGYRPGASVFEKLCFTIESGSCLGLVGFSGSGKTTIVNLILRLYSLNSGKIFIGGFDISLIEKKSLYSQIGAALQDPYLWNDTIENNIRYAKLDASIQQIREAANIACADQFIKALPQGYDTIIGENACKISEGQKQRIAVARAVIKRPRILILDEALACVDAYTEEAIIRNIRNESDRKNNTLIIISHRLSTIRAMDKVFFLNRLGKLEIASHDELIEKNSDYRAYLSGQVDTSRQAIKSAGNDLSLLRFIS